MAPRSIRAEDGGGAGGTGSGDRPFRPRGPKGWRRPDERILDELCERIVRSGVDARALEVTVEDGEVTLDGWVSTRRERDLVHALAEDTLGVTRVHARTRTWADAPAPPGEQGRN